MGAPIDAQIVACPTVSGVAFPSEGAVFINDTRPKLRYPKGLDLANRWGPRALVVAADRDLNPLVEPVVRDLLYAELQCLFDPGAQFFIVATVPNRVSGWQWVLEAAHRDTLMFAGAFAMTDQPVDESQLDGPPRPVSFFTAEALRGIASGEWVAGEWVEVK